VADTGRLSNVDSALRAGWHPVARSEEVGAGPVAARLLGEDWVVVRLGSGEVAAFVDRCPHRMAPLSMGHVVDGELQCCYHGWRFGADGACTRIPALGVDATLPPRARVETAACAERDGLVWVSPDAPVVAIPAWPEFALADGVTVGLAHMPTIQTPASAGLLCDNFLDEAHFPFVHTATIGTAEPEVIGTYEVSVEGWSFSARREHRFSNLLDPEAVAGRRPLEQRRCMTYRYEPPFSLSLRLDMPDAGTWLSIGFWVQPEDEESCRIFSSVVGPELVNPDVRDQLMASELAILMEDVQLQRRFRARGLPLDLTAEVHTRADRVTVELRRALRRFVEVAGSPAEL
jgi:phenylpropionate dioxygenase-like ring-hydroxylating dioxygenase large terminal subunit